MRQLELEYFWPLTEQIPLELDYAGCDKRLSYSSLYATGSVSLCSGSGSNQLVASNLTLDIDSMTFKVQEKPNILRRSLYKALGVKWESK
jgi:hypothetical protein